MGAIIGRFPTAGMDGDSQMDGGIIHHNRKCKDLVFLFIFIAFWVAMIVNSSFGFNQGNPLRYLHLPHCAHCFNFQLLAGENQSFLCKFPYFLYMNQFNFLMHVDLSMGLTMKETSVGTGMGLVICAN